jgi:hypothetical protein
LSTFGATKNFAENLWVGEELFCWDEAAAYVQPGWLRHSHFIHKAAQHEKKQQRKQVATLSTLGAKKQFCTKPYGLVNSSLWVGEELLCWDEATAYVQPRWLCHRHLVHKAAQHTDDSKECRWPH